MQLNDSHPRVPENLKDDFYAIDEVCINCGAPEAVAPDLITHSTEGYGHCYFKRQPSTTDEIQHAINACAVSCVGGLRYGGRKEAILKRIYEQGQEEICDHPPVGIYPAIIWTHTQFLYHGTMRSLADAILKELLAPMPSFSTWIPYLRTNHSNAFEFEWPWGGPSGTRFKGNWDLNGQCSFSLEATQEAEPRSVRYSAARLNQAMLRIPAISGILWFDALGRMYDATEVF